MATDGGSAFPGSKTMLLIKPGSRPPEQDGDSVFVDDPQSVVSIPKYYPGMTIRQYYKAAALTGMLSKEDGDRPFEDAAEVASNYADAMLREDDEHAKGPA